MGALRCAPAPMIIDVMWVLAAASAGGVALADEAGRIRARRQALAVGVPPEPLHGQVRGVEKLRAGEQGDARLVIQLGGRHALKERRLAELGQAEQERWI